MTFRYSAAEKSAPVRLT